LTNWIEYGIIKTKNDRPTDRSYVNIYIQMGDTMIIHVNNNTCWTIDVTNVRNIAMDALERLAIPDDITIDVTMVLVLAIPVTFAFRLDDHIVGDCDCISPTQYQIRVLTNDDWRFTLYHELYHVYEFANGITSNEFACDQFARVMME
jgi:hypothetical protein